LRKLFFKKNIRTQHARALFDFSFLLQFQVYYELDEQRKKTERTDVAICRVEQLCPFPYDLIQRELKRYPSMLIDQILQFIKLLSRVISPPLMSVKRFACH
jgi:hypothetical protein